MARTGIPTEGGEVISPDDIQQEEESASQTEEEIRETIRRNTGLHGIGGGPGGQSGGTRGGGQASPGFGGTGGGGSSTGGGGDQEGTAATPRPDQTGQMQSDDLQGSTDPRFREDLFQSPAQQEQFRAQFEQRLRQRFENPSIEIRAGDIEFKEAGDGRFQGRVDRSRLIGTGRGRTAGTVSNVEEATAGAGVSSEVVRQAKQFEREILAENPELAAEDVSITFDREAGQFRTELTDSAQRGRVTQAGDDSGRLEHSVGRLVDSIERQRSPEAEEIAFEKRQHAIDRLTESIRRQSDISTQRVERGPELRPDTRSPADKLATGIDLDFTIPKSQFDLEEFLGARRRDIGEFAETAGRLSTAVTLENIEAAAQPESPAGEEITIEELTEAGRQQEGTAIRTQQKVTTSAVGLAEFPFSTAELGLTAAELGKFNVEETFEGRGREAVSRSADFVAEGISEEIGSISRSFKEEPIPTSAGVATSLVGTAVGFGAAGRVSPRAGKATRVAVQPIEEAATSGLTRVAPARVRSAFPGGRIDNEEIFLRGVKNAADRVTQRANRTRAITAGETSIRPSPRQAELIERFRPTQPATISEPLGGGGRPSLLAEAMIEPEPVQRAGFGVSRELDPPREVEQPELEPTRSEVLGGGASEMARQELVRAQKAERFAMAGGFEGEFDPVRSEVGRVDLAQRPRVRQFETEARRELDRRADVAIPSVELETLDDSVEIPQQQFGQRFGTDTRQVTELDTELDLDNKQDTRAELRAELNEFLEFRDVKTEFESEIEFESEPTPIEVETEVIRLPEEKRKKDRFDFGDEVFTRTRVFEVTATPGEEISQTFEGIEDGLDTALKGL